MHGDYREETVDPEGDDNYCSTVEVCLLKFWEVQNAKKTGEVMDVEMLLLGAQLIPEGKEHKESIVNGVREAVEKYNYAYVFSFENMRNIKSNEIKQQFRHTGRFLFGLNKVIKVGLGGSASDEICPAIFTASKLLHGDVGLLIMDMPKEEVKKV
ncbi:unnamed protein product, partial [Brassica napus]